MTSARVPVQLLPQAVVQVRPRLGEDVYGSESYDYGTGAVRRTVTGWLQQDSRARADGDGRIQHEQQWLLVTNDPNALPLDRYEWQGLTFETSGPPAPVWTPRGFHHTEIPLRILTG